MSQNRAFQNSLFRCFNENNNSSLLIKFALSMRYATKNDLYQILELLHISPEVQTQVKTLSILAAYLVLNGKQSDVIIKFNPLYDKICAILARGLPKKTIVTLNFLTTLLYMDEENANTRSRTLVVYAQNMIRISGCLTAMSKLFTRGMLHQDMWQSLCRCLAETCCGLEFNQNYCSQLIPLCVQKCQHGKEDVFQLLHSLLCNNERNIQLFYDCGGVRVFNREYLKYEYCLQLLNTLALSPVIKTKILQEVNILYDMQDLCQLFGPSSQVAQWMTIIFHNLNLNSKGITKETSGEEAKNKYEEFIDIKSLNFDRNNDTSVFYQKVMKEILDFEYSENVLSGKIPRINKNDKNPYKHLNRHCKKNIRDLKINKSICKYAPDRSGTYSFSFLSKEFDKTFRKFDNFSSDKNYINSEIVYTHKKSCLHNSNPTNNTRYGLDNTVSNDNESHESLLDFRPAFVSTPKKKFRGRINRTNVTGITKKISSLEKKYRNLQKIISSRAQEEFVSKKIDETKQSYRTVGGRIFNAINESCTTIIKSVKNIFKIKNAVNIPVIPSEKCKIEDMEKINCSYSFMNYMRQRDALLNEQHNATNSYWEQLQNGCNTCNDTQSLKQKLKNDLFLRETVKKLKLGINLFGCDFKKISKTFWPDENYMTPFVLYNLYRKLIVK